jgi:hypothetical protein
MKKPPHRIRDAVAFLRFARMQYGGFFGSCGGFCCLHRRSCSLAGS